ncbi:hypothetical protein C8039_10155 [Halogeometricum sp. wsp3]|nr:hypothetical protein C8039_10155 [Halogeometricum sp. wsp3]
MALFGRLDEIPQVVTAGVRFVPAAVLAALVLPSFVALDASSFAPDKFIASAGAAGVAALAGCMGGTNSGSGSESGSESQGATTGLPQQSDRYCSRCSTSGQS